MKWCHHSDALFSSLPTPPALFKLPSTFFYHHRFYDTEGGAIRIGGRDVRQLQLSSLRGAIGCVPQDLVLFNDNVRYNIAYGNLGASKEVGRTFFC